MVGHQRGQGSIEGRGCLGVEANRAVGTKGPSGRLENEKTTKSKAVDEQQLNL